MLIATKHEKERVLAPLLSPELGVHCFVYPHFDSDVFGTFSGEIERKLGPFETLKSKCLSAMEQAQCDLGIATEGSFGPHPFLFSVPAHEEMIVVLDKKNQWEFVAKTLVTETNFSGTNISTKQALVEFANEVHFPSHGIILKNSVSDFKKAYKDAFNIEELSAQYEDCLANYGAVYAETDMRAMRNPTRMRVIEQVCRKLIEKIKNTCPVCQTPGFDLVEQLPGLPCALCQLPTSSILSDRYACQSCGHSTLTKRRDGKTQEDPMYCSFCNP